MNTAPAPLTAKQVEILNYIRSFHRSYGFPATIRAIAKHFNIGNNGVVCHLRPLVRKGALRRVVIDRSVRYTPVVDEGCCPCCGQPI